MPNERQIAEDMMVYFLSRGGKIESLDEVIAAQSAIG